MEFILKIMPFEIQIMAYIASFIITSIAIAIAIRSYTQNSPRHHQITLTAMTGILLITNIFMGSHVATRLTHVPTVLHSDPAPGSKLDIKNPHITVTFDTPVNFKTLKIYSYPETELTITPKGYLGNKLSVGRTVTVSPDTTYPAGEPILLFFSNIEGPFTHGYGGERLLELAASELPEIEEIRAEQPLVAVAANTKFTATLKGSAFPSSQWHATTIPSHPVSVTQTDATLSIHPNSPFTQGTSYTMTLYQTPVIQRYDTGEILQTFPSRTENTISFTIVNPPFIQQFEPKGTSVNPSQEIMFTFDESMSTADVEKLLTATPDFAKTFIWESGEKILRIKHNTLAKGTPYIIRLPKGTHTAKGGVLETDAIFQFKTAGPVTVIESSPSHGASDISIKSPIQITFDQDITGNFTEAFTLTPKTTGKITINKNTTTFTPDQPFAYDTDYKVELKPGIQSVYGLPSDKVQSITFKTEPQQIALAVPYFKQQDAFTCNIASARMLLAFRGITTDEATLIKTIGLSGTRGNGNPFKGYVSDYGTYWDAVAKGVAPYRPYRVVHNGKLQDVISELSKGNPLMIWGQNGWSDPHDISWTSSDGTYIRAINGMHSAVIRGFRGPQGSPTHILLNDSWRGQYTITVGEFLRRWGYFSVALIID